MCIEIKLYLVPGNVVSQVHAVILRRPGHSAGLEADLQARVVCVSTVRDTDVVLSSVTAWENKT